MTDSNGKPQAIVPAGGGALAHAGGGGGGALDLLGPDASAAAAPESGGQVRKFSAALLLRYKWTIIVTFIVLASVGLTAVWTLVEPDYVARAVLEVRSQVPRYVSRTEYSGPIPMYERYAMSQVEIIKSVTVLERVVPQLKETTWYNEPPSKLDQALGRPQKAPLARLNKVVGARPKIGTELIEITARTRTPDDAATIANAVLNEYLKFASEQSSDEDIKLRNQLENDVRKIEAEISFIDRKIADAEDDLGSAAPEELMANRAERLDAIEAELDRTRLDLKVAREQLEEMTASTAADRSETETGADAAADEPVVYEADGEWLRLSSELRQLENRLEMKRARFGETHPDIVRLKRQVEFAQQAVAERERALQDMPMTAAQVAPRDPTPGRPVSAKVLKFQIQLMEIQQKNLAEYHAELRGEFENEFATARMLRKYREQLENNKDRLTEFRNRLAELDERSKVPATIRTIAKAHIPEVPENDKRVMFSGAVLAMALAAGFVLAYLRLSSSPEVHEAGELRSSVQGAFLGHLPLQRGRDALPPETCPFIAEAVRMIRTSIVPRLAQGEGANVIQIASATPGAGKSTFAMLLGRSFAQFGRRVLLVDADLRRPALAKRFAIEPKPGLLDLLQGHDTDAIRDTGIRRLSIMPAGGSISGSESELLASERFGELLARWRKQFDLIIFDGPPLIGAADAAMLSRHVEGAVMVVRERHCHRGAILDSLAMLSAAGGRLLGTAFIGTPGGATGYGYGYTYGYGHYAYGGKAEPSEGFVKADSQTS